MAWELGKVDRMVLLCGMAYHGSGFPSSGCLSLGLARVIVTYLVPVFRLVGDVGWEVVLVVRVGSG